MCFFSIGWGHLCLDKIKVLLVKMEEGGRIDVRQPNAPATLLVKSTVISSYSTWQHTRMEGDQKDSWGRWGGISRDQSEQEKKIPFTETNKERLLFLMTVMSLQNNSVTLDNSFYFTSNLTERAPAQLFPTDQDSSCRGGGVANRQQLWLNNCKQEFRGKPLGINGHVVQPVFFFLRYSWFIILVSVVQYFYRLKSI